MIALLLTLVAVLVPFVLIVLAAARYAEWKEFDFNRRVDRLRARRLGARRQA